MAKWVIESPQQEESLLGQAGRVATASGVKGLQSLEDLASLFGAKEYFHPASYVKEQFGITPEYLEPQGAIESGIQRFAYGAPFAAGLGATLGAGALPALAPLAAGSSAAAGLNYLGAPEIVQDIAQLGGEIASGRALGKLPSIAKVRRAADAALRAAIKPGTKVSFPNTERALKEASKALNVTGETLSRTVTSALYPVEKNIAVPKGSWRNILKETPSLGSKSSITQSAIAKPVNAMIGKIQHAQGNPLELLDARKWLGKEIYKWPVEVRASFGEPVRRAITQDLQAYGNTINQAFAEGLKTRDALTIAKYMKTPLTNFFVEYPILRNQLGDKFISLMQHPEKFVRNMISNSEARSIYGKMLGSIFSNNPAEFISYGKELKDFLPSSEKSTSPSKWIIESPK